MSIESRGHLVHIDTHLCFDAVATRLLEQVTALPI